MKIIEYLFFKYYHFQVKVGNDNIAPFSANLIICVIFELIYEDILLFCLRFIPYFSNSPLPPWYCSLLVYVFVFICLYFFTIYKSKYKTILTSYEKEWKNKKNLGAVLFAVIPIIIFFVELFI